MEWILAAATILGGIAALHYFWRWWRPPTQSEASPLNKPPEAALDPRPLKHLEEQGRANALETSLASGSLADRGEVNGGHLGLTNRQVKLVSQLAAAAERAGNDAWFLVIEAPGRDPVALFTSSENVSGVGTGDVSELEAVGFIRVIGTNSQGRPKYAVTNRGFDFCRHSARSETASLPQEHREMTTTDSRGGSQGPHQATTDSSSTDVFICHASEDKDTVARPLASELQHRGFTVWYDEYVLRLGDSLPTEIDRGLASCRFGVVILSPDFFAKNWPRRELDGLTEREVRGGKKVILPVWHNVTLEDVERYSPTLGSKLAISTAKGMPSVVDEIVKVVDPPTVDQAVGANDRSSVTENAPSQKSKLLQEGEGKIQDLRDPFYDWQTGEKVSLDDFWDGVDRFVRWRDRLCRFLRDYVEDGEDLSNFVNSRLRDDPLIKIIIPAGRYPDVGGKHATTMADREIIIPRPEEAVASSWEPGRYYITDTQGKKRFEEYKSKLFKNLGKVAAEIDGHIAERGYRGQRNASLD